MPDIFANAGYTPPTPDETSSNLAPTPDQQSSGGGLDLNPVDLAEGAIGNVGKALFGNGAPSPESVAPPSDVTGAPSFTAPKDTGLTGALAGIGGQLAQIRRGWVERYPHPESAAVRQRSANPVRATGIVDEVE